LGETLDEHDDEENLVNTILYFAYGSNMNVDQMAERCPGADCLGVAELRDHAWMISLRNVATVRFSPGRIVYGVLWSIAPGHEQTLDRFEVVARGNYGRHWFPVVRRGGEVVTPLIYIDHRAIPGTPKPGYVERVVAGAQAHGLPEAYVRELLAWASPAPSR